MADQNRIYDPFIEDTSVIEENGTVDAIRQSSIDQVLPFFLKLRESQNQTIADVKVAYTGTTSADRVNWLANRISAVNNRVAFITSRMEDFRKTKAIYGGGGTDSEYVALANVLSLVPVGGPLFSWAGKLIATDDAAYSANIISQVGAYVAGYTYDAKQLVEIKTQLLAEYKKADSATIDTGTKKPAADAPAPWPWYYYAGGALLLLILLLYLKRKRNRR